ncbi:helix-turn-helix domain-containing protein [Georgenia muralis]
MLRWQEVSRLDDLFEDLPEHLTVEQLAGVLGVTKPTAYGWLQKGYIPAYKIGGAWMIVRDEVKDHLAAHRNRPLTPSPANDED